MRTLVLASIFLFCLLATAISEEVSYSTLVPKTAKSMAMGGVFSSVPSSEFSFFGNPAFFASNTSSFAIPTFDVWGYGHPSSGFGRLGSTLGAIGGNGSFLSRAFRILSEDGSSGGGASAGLTLAGKNVGLGFFMTTDNRIEGLKADKTVSSDTEASFVLGIGFPIDLGSTRLSLGGDFRPFYRISLRDESGGDPDLSKVIENGSNGMYADAFFGAAIDLGASLRFGAFSLGLSVRDLSPAYPVYTEKLSKLLSTIGSGNMSGTSSSLEARLAPSISAGLSWSPKIAPGKLEPAFYFELQDIVGVAEGWEGPESVLDLVHAGTEVRFFKVMTLRGGFDRGRMSAGAGLKLLFLDLNAAIFTEREWSLPGDDSDSGLALQAAIRF
jgi:hypothetical protein